MTRPTRFLPTLLGQATLIGALLCAGCGPFGYLKKVSRDADRAVADAKAAGAEEYAPYEYWGSQAYLEQAKIMMGYSEYERSFDYGTRATQLANEAKAKADRVASGSSTERDPNIATPNEVPTESGEPAAGGDASGDAAAGGGEASAGGSVDLSTGGGQ